SGEKSRVPNQPPRIIDLKAYDDGTAMVQIIRRNTSATPPTGTVCVESLLSLRIIHLNGSVTEIDADLGIQYLNYCFRSDYVEEFSYMNPVTNAWVPNNAAIRMNIDPRHGFLRFSQVTRQNYSEWKQYDVFTNLVNSTRSIVTPFFNPFYIKIRFLSSGSVLSLSTIEQLTPYPASEYIVHTLTYGGYALTSYNQSRDGLSLNFYLFLYDESENPVRWELPEPQSTNFAGANDILSNNTLLLARTETTNSWNHGYRNFMVNTSNPAINATISSATSNISITYNDQVDLSQGNITIYQIIDSGNVIARQIVSAAFFASLKSQLSQFIPVKLDRLSSSENSQVINGGTPSEQAIISIEISEPKNNSERNVPLVIQDLNTMVQNSAITMISQGNVTRYLDGGYGFTVSPFWIIMDENTRKKFFAWFSRNGKVVSIFTLLAASDIEALKILQSNLAGIRHGTPSQQKSDDEDDDTGGSKKNMDVKRKSRSGKDNEKADEYNKYKTPGDNYAKDDYSWATDRTRASRTSTMSSSDETMINGDPRASRSSVREST
ncbi:14528_t:CDS:2, partial [Racocetra fulgida]